MFSHLLFHDLCNLRFKGFHSLLLGIDLLFLRRDGLLLSTCQFRNSLIRQGFLVETFDVLRQIFLQRVLKDEILGASTDKEHQHEASTDCAKDSENAGPLNFLMRHLISGIESVNAGIVEIFILEVHDVLSFVTI